MTVPSVARPVVASTSSDDFTVSSRYSMVNAMPSARSSPTSAARSVFRRTRGDEGCAGGVAGSTTVTAFAPDPGSASKAAYDPRREVTVSYTHLRAHETRHDLVCRLLLEKKTDISLLPITYTPRLHNNSDAITKSKNT